MPQSPSRRDLFRAIGALAGGLAVGGASSGCGAVRSGFTGAPISANTLTYWDLLGGGDGVRMRALEDEFRQANPNIGLESTTLQWGNPYYTKLSLATLGAQPPDIALSHLTRVPTLVGADLLEPFRIDDLERFGMTPGNFVETAIESATIDGEIYAIPLDTHPFVTFYNTEICDQAGLLDSAGRLREFEGPDAFVEAMAKAKEVSGVVGGSLSSIGDYATPWRFFYSIYSQLGGEMLRGDEPDEIVDPDLALEAMRFMRRLTVEEEVVSRDLDYPSAVAQFAEGRAGFYFEGEWEVSTFLETGTPFSMTRFPHVFGDDYVVQADSHTYVMPRRRQQDQGKVDMALTFIKFILDHGIAWAEGGHVPTWLPVQDDPEYQALDPQANYAEVAEVAVYDPPAWFAGSGSNFEQIIGYTLGEVLSGRQTPEQALRRIQQGISKLAKTPTPVEGV